MACYTICLNLPPEEVQRYYQGSARWLLAQAQTGERLQLPLSCLREFITHDGLSGCFKVETDAQHKLSSIVRIGAFAY